MPTITDWLMVVITIVYVLATILICVFNYRSAKATREQVLEQKRQFDEGNKPCVDITFEIIRSGLLALKIQNTGSKMATNVNVSLNKNCTDLYSLSNKSHFEYIEKLLKSKFHLGVNQSFFVFLCSHIQIHDLKNTNLILDISYSDRQSNMYSDQITISFDSYDWMLIYDSPIEDIRTYQKKLSECSMDELKLMNKIYKDINTKQKRES